MADRLAALKARIKAKEAKNTEELKGRLEAVNKDWNESQAKEREERKQELEKRKASAAAGVDAKRAKTQETIAGQKKLPNCTCGSQVDLKTVSREGPNNGRDYITCKKGKKEFGGCGFFVWARKGEYVLPGQDNSAGPKELPMCRCQNVVELKTVFKEGPNQGRNYITCSKGKQEFGGCGFFEWAAKGEYVSAETATGPKELPKCECGEIVDLKTATKEGPNQGRDYVTCPRGKKEFGGCGFFAWAAKGEYKSPEIATGPKELPKCQCGELAELKTVTKEGPNQGRDYITCLKGKKDFGGCGFFAWAAKGEYKAAEAESSADLVPASESASTMSDASAPVLGTSSSRVCNCKSPAALKSVGKQGAHFGRNFLHCSKGRKDQGGCGFFVWMIDGVPLAQAGA
eukprot:TRINITY_DN73938_c0_g1_i1.p1 TRINITY_DN73938_c0_g1~~TRINITY_DN73938_c0_g1_i1.p1  ORF type:complete len:401 (+),score=81.95 TRINITY_DN73938_c0_g1_i1:42-1244(+)